MGGEAQLCFSREISGEAEIDIDRDTHRMIGVEPLGDIRGDTHRMIGVEPLPRRYRWECTVRDRWECAERERYIGGGVQKTKSTYRWLAR